MDVRLPDGTVIKNVPQGTTKAQLVAKLKANNYTLSPDIEAAAVATPAAPQESFGQQVLGGAASTLDLGASAALGTAQWLAYPFRRAAGIVTGETAGDIQASQERVANAIGSPFGKILGVAQSPSYQNNLLRQGMTFVGNKMGDAAAATSAATGIPEPDVLNMMQSVLAVAGVKAPVKIAGTVISKIPVANLPAKVVRGAVRHAQDILDPKTKFYMGVAEGRAPELISAARRPSTEIIPGVRPTFAQATADVGMPTVAAVGEQATKVRPTEALAIRDAQEAARVGQLSAIENTPAVRRQVIAARKRRANPLYQAAETAGDVVDVTPTLGYIDDLIKANPGNKSLVTAMKEVRQGLTKPVKTTVEVTQPNGKVVLKQKTTLEPRTNAKEVMSTLDGMKDIMSREDNRFIKSELTNIKEDLTQAIPSMKEATTAFRKGSAPINQMDVGAFLRQKLEGATPDSPQRAAAFADAVRNAPQTIKRALDGQPRYEKLTEVLSPPQMARVDRVVADLSRDARVKEMVQLGRENAPKLRTPVEGLGVPNLFNRVASIATEIVRRLEGKVNQKLAMEIALEFLDADRAAAALETALRRSQSRGRAPGPTKPAAGPAKRLLTRAPLIAAPNQMNNQENRNQMVR